MIQLKISDIYNDVALDEINSAENGNLTFSMFNRISKRGELRLLDYLTSDIENIKPPFEYTSQKVKDFLSPLITKYSAQVIGGKIEKPTSYYGFENMFLLGNAKSDCDSKTTEACNIGIELLDGNKFFERCNTWIEGLKPSLSKPIAKEVGNRFEFLPKDLGSITLEYVRYPVFGKIITQMDNVYNEEVVNENLSINYEWDESCRELLVFFISSFFSTHTRERALAEQHQVTPKLVRG